MPVLTPEEWAKKYPDDRRHTGQTIHIGYRPNSAPASEPPAPVPEPTEAQRALIEDYLFAIKDAADAATFVRMFQGATTAAWQRAIERGKEATAAVREAGITQAMIAKVRSERTTK